MKPYKCEPCFFVTYNKSEYTRHLRTKKHQTNCPDEVIDLPIVEPAIQNVNTKSFKCPDCRDLFYSDAELIEHKKSCPVALHIKALMLEKEMEKFEIQKEKFELEKENLQLKLKLENALKRLNVNEKFHEDV